MKVGKLVRSVFSEVRELSSAMNSHAAAAHRETGKGYASQAIEIVRLRGGLGKLAADEYYHYGLYDDQRYTWEQKKEFFGYRMENALIPILKEGWWLGLANDKVIAYAYLSGLGFPIPEIYALYHRIRDGGTICVLRSPEALTNFVRTERRPYIIKPVFGMAGRDVFAVREYDPEKNVVAFSDNTRMAVEAFVAKVCAVRDRGGLLIQELLQPHPEIRAVCGDRICTVRMVTLMDGDGPQLIATIWRIATGTSITDNYQRGLSGNLVAPVDPMTGVVERTCSGAGTSIRYVEDHPDTGRRLRGFQLPDWAAARDLCLAATAAIPSLAMQAWDVALTSRGPVLLEVNVNGGMTLPQVSTGAGIFRGPLAKFLAKHGYPRGAVRRSTKGSG